MIVDSFYKVDFIVFLYSQDGFLNGGYGWHVEFMDYFLLINMVSMVDFILDVVT
jgi:hypothetical protein